MAGVWDIAPAWARHRMMTRLPNALMGGTWAMREAGTEYLPRKHGEGADDYGRRLKCAHLDNFYQRTVNSYLGQVFQKDISIHEPLGAPAYDPAFFDAFQEDVNLAGSSLSMFGREVFRNGLVDGVAFILTDYTRFRTRETPSGRLEFWDDSAGEWRPKTPLTDRGLNARPYLISVKAGQVLDAYQDAENGRVSLRHFRYEVSGETPRDADGISRSAVRRVVAWWPDRWETWEEVEGRRTRTDSGPNFLREVPAAVFMPGEPALSLAAYPPLGDLAEMNRVYWDAMSDHDERMMRFVRSPAFLARCLGIDAARPVEFGPSRLLVTERQEAELKSVGVDAASAARSAEDLAEKREAMRDYGLQALRANVTATISENAAAGSAANLKGWCNGFKDCLENALRLAARYQGWDDGPAVGVNTRFRYVMDMDLLGWLSRMIMPAGPIRPEHLVECYRMMQFNTDEYSLEDILDPGYRRELEKSAEAERLLFGGEPEPAGYKSPSPQGEGGAPPAPLRGRQ